MYTIVFEEFQYLMKLHYSQTKMITGFFGVPFQYLMKLHYSQTDKNTEVVGKAFQYLMKLHYSQTVSLTFGNLYCFSTL